MKVNSSLRPLDGDGMRLVFAGHLLHRVRVATLHGGMDVVVFLGNMTKAQVQQCVQLIQHPLDLLVVAAVEIRQPRRQERPSRPLGRCRPREADAAEFLKDNFSFQAVFYGFPLKTTHPSQFTLQV